MENFKQFRRTQIAEMRPVTEEEIKLFEVMDNIPIAWAVDVATPIVLLSISDADRKNGSPKLGDMIARNPKNHLDQWLVAEQYFKDNFEQVSEGKNKNFV